MLNEIKQAAETLSDSTATWVRRRDAADVLGQCAGDAVAALSRHAKDHDTDVRDAVSKALQHVGIPLAAESGRSYTLDELAKACAKPVERTVAPHGEGYMVTVRLQNDRTQKVYLEPFDRKDGARLVRIFTYCGKPTPESLRWALKTNVSIPKGALGLAGGGNDEQFVLVVCYEAANAAPQEIKLAVKEIAFYGDWMEQKLSGLDEL